MKKDDIYFMKLALKEAKKAYDHEEVPIGCVLVDENNKIIARGYNKKEMNEDVSAHAEIICLKKASKKLQNWRLNNSTMYVTLEPCLMCASALIQSRIKRVVFALKETNTGAFGGHSNAREIENSNIEITSGILEEESKNLIQSFFKEKRKK